MLTSEGVGATLAGWTMQDGSLWFPTTRGIVSIDPGRRDTEPPRVSIEGATIDRTPIVLDGPIRVRPGQENLEIRYTGLSWSRPHATRFRFRLNGLDHGWIDAADRRTAYYSHLPPGAYAFTVIADNGEGVWSPAGATLAVVVLPRFHQTWWFRGIAGFGLVALVGLSWRYRGRQMRRAQDAQRAFSRQLIASQEAERQRIAAELHDSLGQNLLVVKNRALLAALSHAADGDTRRQFDEISATVAESLDEVRAISYNLRPHHLDQLGLTTTIRAMIDRVTSSAGIAVTGALDDVDGVFPPADEITIYRIVQESLNNVVKHSGARDARVVVRSHEDHVTITIHDSGCGFNHSSLQAGRSIPGGFGLKGLAERVQMLGGTCAIDSSPGRGTTIAVRLEIRQQGSPNGA
jgi:signal transduction histidine kinase